MLSQRRWDDAEKVVKDLPSHVSGASIYSVLGMIHALRSEWIAASNSFGLTVQVLPEDAAAYYQLAAVLLKIGDLEAYRRHCQKILGQFGNTSDPQHAERAVKACLVVSNANVDFAMMNKLANLAVAAGPAHRDLPFFQFAKGLSEFRQGHFGSATDWLKPVAAELGDANRAVQASMVLAMAEYRLNRVDEARETFRRGINLAEKRLPGPNGPVPKTRWNDWILVPLLINEARDLIEPTNAGPNPK